MSFELLAVIILSFFAFLFAFLKIDFCKEETVALEADLKDIRKDIVDLENLYHFEKNASKFEEYKKLTGAAHISQHDCEVEFRDNWFNLVVKFPFNKIDNELSKVKAILELSCPKKCAKAKRK